jgi:hypothetical protein
MVDGRDLNSEKLPFSPVLQNLKFLGSGKDKGPRWHGLCISGPPDIMFSACQRLLDTDLLRFGEDYMFGR